MRKDKKSGKAGKPAVQIKTTVPTGKPTKSKELSEKELDSVAGGAMSYSYHTAS
jgi:bacteriocin-like protein